VERERRRENSPNRRAPPTNPAPHRRAPFPSRRRRSLGCWAWPRGVQEERGGGAGSQAEQKSLSRQRPRAHFLALSPEKGMVGVQADAPWTWSVDDRTRWLCVSVCSVVDCVGIGRCNQSPERGLVYGPGACVRGERGSLRFQSSWHEQRVGHADFFTNVALACISLPNKQFTNVT
jgi:hypothetical protein